MLNAFEFEWIAKLTRCISANRLVTGILPHKPKTKRPRKRNERNSNEAPKILGLLETAAEWRRQLDSGELANQAEIARREAVTRARVTQILALMKLAPEIRERIITNPWLPGGAEITERVLRTICATGSAVEQAQMFDTLLPAEISCP